MTAVLLEAQPVSEAPLAIALDFTPSVPIRRGALRRTLARRGVRIGLLLAVLAVAGIMLGPRLAHHAHSLADLPAPAWPWLVACGLVVSCHFLAAAWSLRAASTLPLPVRRTVAVQVSAAAANRLLPVGLGATAVNVRYLERVGLPRAGAISVVAAGKVANGLVHIGCTALALALAGDTMLPVDPATLVRGWKAAAIASGAAVLLCVAVVVAARHSGLRSRVGPHLVAARMQIIDLVRRPRAGCALLAATVAEKAVQIAGLIAAVQAFGGGVALWAVAVVYLAGSAVGGATPAPGGIGSIDAALLVGLTAAGGASGAMFGAVLAYRVLGFWLPVLPGALLLPALHRRGAL